MIVLIVGLLGWPIAVRWSPERVGGVILFSAGINLAACWVSFVPIMIVRRKCRSYLPQAALGAMTIRLLVVAGTMLTAMTVGDWPTMALSVWMTVFYLALLVVETTVTVRLLNSAIESPEFPS